MENSQNDSARVPLLKTHRDLKTKVVCKGLNTIEVINNDEAIDVDEIDEEPERHLLNNASAEMKVKDMLDYFATIPKDDEIEDNLARQILNALRFLRENTSSTKKKTIKKGSYAAEGNRKHDLLGF
ncbi:hypothetical protein NECID01_0620 [Nematocida sp. AWRm77]|nr:hypothetical protein NECID01_0620 [Nematocida sp. AWRm77]